MLRSLRINGSALTAERARLDTISENIANAETTRGVDGKPYRRKEVVFEMIQDEAGGAGGVRVAEVIESKQPAPRVYEPGHPDADAQGYLELPNVNIVDEMVDLTAASRAYEANIAAINTGKQLFARALDLGRG